jgi:uncharacterized protein
MVAECQRCLIALAADDAHYFVDRFASQDKWRILAHFLEQTTFFDIETEGLEYEAPITVISCWHRGKLHAFTEPESLDAFLELLDEVVLLASFNGNSFDVPRILNTFHIPTLPCPHVDLRWICHHHGWKGSLKEITWRLGFLRPHDLADVDGAMALRLWNRWVQQKDWQARDLVIRYCGSDVLLLVMLAHRLVGLDTTGLDQLWAHVAPSREPILRSESPGVSVSIQSATQGSLSRLRALRTRCAG